MYPSRELNKMLHLLKKFSQRFLLLFSTTGYRRNVWPAVPELSDRHIRNCRLVENREKLLELIPKHGACAEIGIWKCDFSQKIMDIIQPEVLHLVDIDPESISIANARFGDEISDGKVKVHHNDSSDTLLSMPDHYFDWIYIDGDHSYTGVKKDLEAARAKLKNNGLISMNDYIFLGPSDLAKYGVIEAVNEFCIDHDFEIIHFALQGRMYNDVTLRQRRPSS